MALNRKNGEETHEAESADRRQFLRNAMRAGGAAALLLSSASRRLLAGSLALNSRQMEAARQAQQAQGAPPDPGRLEAEAAQPAEMGGSFQDCPCTSCTGTCRGGCTSCEGCKGCTANCASGCDNNCSGGCEGSCKGYCSGCRGVNL